jgi:hypothetical protein
MNNAHHLETTVQQDGTLVLEHLPFSAGQQVEVIILPQSPRSYALRGTPVRYDKPTEPVADEDWEAQK